MAIPWLAVLQSVPWTDVISNAPKLADGARKLWNTVGGNAAPQAAPVAPAEQVSSPEAQAIATLEARAQALESAVKDLHGQMLSSSELIKALAEQNAQLVSRLEIMRGRMLWLGATGAVLALIALVGLLLVFTRHGGA